MIDVTVYDGKYRYTFDKDGAMAFRHGKEWRDCTGDGFILALAQDLEEARQERDALAAHVERVREAANIVLKNSWSPDHQALNVALADDTPETSLARLIAEKQIEAIHRLHNRYCNELEGKGSIAGLVHDEVRELRRQAEQNAKE